MLDAADLAGTRATVETRMVHRVAVERSAVATSGGAEAVGGANTTLTADTAIGATSVAVAAATHVAAGRFLRVGDVGEREVAVVGAGYVSGLTVPTVSPLTVVHDSGDQVRELVDAGAMTLDDWGQPVMGWATHATVPAFIVQKSAREVALLSQGGAVVSTLTIGLPAGTDVLASDRLYHDEATCPVTADDLGTHYYQLVNIPDERSELVYLRCDATAVE